MANYSSSRKKKTRPGKKWDNSKRSKLKGKPGDKKRGSSSAPKRGGSSSRRGGSRGGRSVAKKFDPSLFVKKVEERTPAQVYVAKHSFEDFAIDDRLKKNIASKGYVSPTPIQDQAIPYLLDGRDVIGTANTGTGKTAAFLIPLIHNVLVGKTSRVLIIAPTRELAVQIRDEFKSFVGDIGIRSVLCIGGASIYMQTRSLKNNPKFVIGTPGRLKDLENNKNINFNKYDAIVLDEVDRMLDMGFIKDISYIIDKLPKERHSLFFSATLTKSLQTVMDRFLQDPVAVSVKTRQSAENVNQEIIRVGQKSKVEIVHDLLIKPEFNKVLIFLRTKRTVDKLAKELNERGFTVAVIHSNKTQAQRIKALQLFKAGKVHVLLATDVVARGIDIDDISHVINFDLPQTHEDYIHRIGRTGRANKIGQAITLV